MGDIEVDCAQCGSVFSRPKRRYGEAIKNHWRQFCSHECQIKYKSKERFTKKCNTCGKPVERLASRIRPSTHVFCSHKCSAKFTNHYRETRLIIAKRKRLLEKPICANPKCLNKIGINNKVYCSPECKIEATKIHDYKFVIKKIKEFANREGRIPSKYESPSLYSRARVGFGTWNAAIQAAGYDPNREMYARHHIANDGHKCDSLAEKIVDDYLYYRRIEHRVHVHYPWKNGMKCDFLVGDNWIEIFGLAGGNKRYDQLKEAKLKLATEYKIKIIPLTLMDVYRGKIETRLDMLF